MYKRLLLIITVLLIITCVITACSNSKNESELITANVKYSDVAQNSDFEKYNNVFSAGTEIELEKGNYYLVKVTCEINNGSSKELSNLDFVPYKDEFIMCEAGGIDFEPTYSIEPNSSETFEAYVYFSKSLDNEEKIKKQLENTAFKFQAILNKKSAINGDGIEITFETNS